MSGIRYPHDMPTVRTFELVDNYDGQWMAYLAPGGARFSPLFDTQDEARSWVIGQYPDFKEA